MDDVQTRDSKVEELAIPQILLDNYDLIAGAAPNQSFTFENKTTKN